MSPSEWIPTLLIILVLIAAFVLIGIFVSAPRPSPWILAAGIACWVIFLLCIMHG